VTASFGTSGTIYAFSRKPVVDPAGEIAAFCSSTGGWLPLLCTMNVTGVTEQVRALFGWSLSELETAAAGAPAGSGGLTLLPYLDGERTPNLPKGTGVYFGLNRTTLAQGHLARAAIEGATLGMNYGLQAARRPGREGPRDPPDRRRRAFGLWRQIAADIFRRPGRGDGPGRERGPRGRPPGGLVRLAGPRLGRRARRALRKERLPGRVDALRARPGARALYRERQRFHDGLGLDLRRAFEAR
jgi:xylulokinase